MSDHVPHTLFATGLCKRLGGRLVLDRVDLTIDAPGSIALCGENGAGKSTCLRILAGVIAADEGALLFDGDPLDEDNRRARRHLGYVPESADPMPHLSVGELLALVAALKRAPPLAGEVIDRLGARSILSQRIGTLSLGQRRRACLCAALVGDPWLLLLDEPTNGLDPDGVKLLAELLREHAGRGGAALVATHDLAFAEVIGARTWKLASGRLQVS